MEFSEGKSIDTTHFILTCKIIGGPPQEIGMIPRASMRRPEEVKFRTKDEEKAADEINQEGTRRENSADSKVVNLESFEILGMMG